MEARVNVRRLLVRLDKAQGNGDERIWLRQVFYYFVYNTTGMLISKSLAFLATQDVKGLGPEWELKRDLAQEKLDVRLC